MWEYFETRAYQSKDINELLTPVNDSVFDFKVWKEPETLSTY